MMDHASGSNAQRREVLPKEERDRRAMFARRRREIRAAASLSKSHNSIECDLPFRLSGSQAKVAYALRMNCETLIRDAGIDRVGFLTLTVGDVGTDGRFLQVFDSSEASRRFNSLRPVLAELFDRWIVVTERHKNKAVHFHLLGVMRAKVDIRRGFDWENFTAANAARARGAVDERAELAYSVAAAPVLRDAWRMLRETLPGYGFGRAELTPIRKTGEAVASYVSKYVEKNLFNRLAEDVGKRLVRYGGWNKRQLRPNDFGWGTPGATAWRKGAQACAATVGITEPEQMAQYLGPRWAWRISRGMGYVAAQVEKHSVLDSIEWARASMRGEMDSCERRRRDLESLCGKTIEDHWFFDEIKEAA